MRISFSLLLGVVLSLHSMQAIADEIDIPNDFAQQCDSTECETYRAVCLAEWSNVMLGIATSGGSGGFAECVIDLGLNIPFTASDITSILNTKDPDKVEALWSRFAFDQMCDVLSCLPANNPAVVAGRAACLTLRPCMAHQTCETAFQACKGSIIGRPADGPNGEICGRTSVTHHCSTPFTQMDEECTRMANNSGYGDARNERAACRANCLANTIALQIKSCDSALQATPSQPEVPSVPGGQAAGQESSVHPREAKNMNNKKGGEFIR